MDALKLIVTIDTEEDDWSEYSRTPRSLSNIDRIPDLQRLFDDLRVKPTYLVSYPIAVNERAGSILREILWKGRCEIGAHCHPWNTPPFEEEISRHNSMLCNLPAETQFRKLYVLHGAIRETFGVESVGFRAGRWGFSEEVARNISRLGYKVDSSVTPYTDWSACGGPDFSDRSPECKILTGGGSATDGDGTGLVEVPATIGFLQENFRICGKIYHAARKDPMRSLKVPGLLHRLRIVNKVWLSPEMNEAEEMIRLTQRIRRNGYPLVNMTFHSTTLSAGKTPFVKTEEEERHFLRKIRTYLENAIDSGAEPIGLSEAAKLL